MLIYLLIVVFPIPYKDPGPPVYEYNVSGLSGIPKKEFTALPIWLNILPDSGVDSGWFVVGGFIVVSGAIFSSKNCISLLLLSVARVLSKSSM